jgi:hypothetical protein
MHGTSGEETIWEDLVSGFLRNRVENVGWTDWLKIGSDSSLFEWGNEHFDSIKGGNFLSS